MGQGAASVVMPFRKILFPVDFSDSSLAMVPYVRELTQRFSADLTVLNAFHLAPDYFVAPRIEDSCDDEPKAATPYTPAIQELRRQRESRVHEFASVQFPGLAHTARVEDGDPVTVIESVAQREEVDLIMMPTKGLGRFRRLLLGSVTAKVLHDLGCPVFTSAHALGPESASHSGFLSILCAVDSIPEARAIFKVAGFLARAYEAKICLLHMQRATGENGAEASAESIWDGFGRALNCGAEGSANSVKSTVRILSAAIPEGIRRTAIEESADLVVVGRGHQDAGISRIWSHLYEIIRESPCPVLSV